MKMPWANGGWLLSKRTKPVLMRSVVAQGIIVRRSSWVMARVQRRLRCANAKGLGHDRGAWVLETEIYRRQSPCCVA